VLTFIRHAAFDEWLHRLKDAKAKARILARITSAAHGNFGDCKPVGDGVSEMRVHAGPGYRLYFARHGKVVYVLLCGGDKSTQDRDIRRAKALAEEIEGEGT
jgi:putative addiction module killer protein